MDSPEAETHPELGARIMMFLFGESWYYFTKYHSRFLAKRDGMEPSALCAADKLATALTPNWLYLPMIRLTGEIHEYKRLAENPSKYHNEKRGPMTDLEWVTRMKKHMREYAFNYVKETASVAGN